MPGGAVSEFMSVDPSTGKELARFGLFDPGELELRVAGARVCFDRWRRVPLPERAQLVRNMAAVLEMRGDPLAALMAQEMGKPITQGRAEVAKCAWAARYYADHVQHFLMAEPAETPASASYVTPQPLGAILAVMPWNFPLWQVVRAATPALLAGNTVLVKHAPNVPQCALALEDAYREAGFPDGTLQNLFVGHDQVADLIADPRVRGVTLTGSVPAGKAVAQLAAAQIKPTVLELGGSDPYIILEDADIEEAARLCAQSRLNNAGQSCIAAKRLIVVDAVREPFTAALVAAMSEVRMGDPQEEQTEMGPLARSDLRDTLQRQVEVSMAFGAECLLGGQTPAGPGWFYPPTVLSGVTPDMPAYTEEVFGPVASVVSVPDRAAAITCANDTVFGLGAAIFTADVAEGERIAREELHAGSCFVNTFVRSDPRLPFGGIRESGYGRELGKQGMLAFTNAKTVWVA